MGDQIHAEGVPMPGSEEARRAWVVRMRQSFSPPAMLLPDGSVDQGFFKPKRVVLVHDKRWGDSERDMLIAGLEKWGVGSWREISESLLHGWDDQQLRVRTCRLLGSQSLARYVGWKGNAQAVDAEYQTNKRIGAATGCWKAGMLVEDDQGTLAKYLAGQQTQQQQGQGAQGRQKQGQQGPGQQQEGQQLGQQAEGQQGQEQPQEKRKTGTQKGKSDVQKGKRDAQKAKRGETQAMQCDDDACLGDGQQQAMAVD